MAWPSIYSNQCVNDFAEVDDFLTLKSVLWVLDELPNMSWPDKVEDDGSIISTTRGLSQKLEELG